MEKFPQATLEDNLEVAREQLQSMLEAGVLPVITIPRKYAEAIKNGLRKSSCWLHEGTISGTIGREAYRAEEDRIVARIKTPADQIEPRLTGPDSSFHGIVTFRGPIQPSQIEVLENL